jgi:hypothetical protein
MSVQSSVRVGSSMSLVCEGRVGVSASVLEFVTRKLLLARQAESQGGKWCLSISVRSVEPSVSVVDFGTFGSFSNVRSYSTMGSRVFAFGDARLGRSCPVLDLASIGSALSIKSWI